MSRSLAVSPKHGVNPSLPVCFFCREEKGEIIFFGKLPGDVEAPKHPIVDYVPCRKCQEKFADGVLIIEVSKSPNVENQPSITRCSPFAYPTGRYSVVVPEALRNQYKPGSAALMLTDDYEKTFGNIEEK